MVAVTNRLPPSDQVRGHASPVLALVTTITMSTSPCSGRRRRDAVQPGFGPSFTESDLINISLRETSVAVAAADVDPSQSISRPHPAPAAIVGCEGEAIIKERKAVKATMGEPVM